MEKFWKRLWTEINLDNLIYNFKLLKASISDSTKMCCVVKANAYGHNAPQVARTLEQAGADWFAVSNIEEAIELREFGIKIPILILGYTPPECAAILSANNISQCVYSPEYADKLSKCAVDNNCLVNIHIKLDTGMGRIGYQCKDKSCITEILESCRKQGLVCEGIFTHFAKSDCGEDGREFTYNQYKLFQEAVSALSAEGVSFTYRHCANSAAAIEYPEYNLDMVRVGILLYGLMPSSKTQSLPQLKPVMSLKTVVSHVKRISVGATVSYGGEFVADREMTVATVPMGYADGFWRSNSKTDFSLLIRGHKAKIIGKICMDQLMLDVTDIKDVSLGDEVTVFGDGELINTVDDLASANATINYEIVCSVGKRVPRVFIKDGRVNSVHLGLLDTTLN